jgi:hypothetical protein
MVVVYENDADGDGVDDAEFYGNETGIPTDAQLRDDFAWNTLWRRNRSDSQVAEPIEGRSSQSTQNNESHAGTVQRACLAEQLIKCTIDLLFCAGFTIPESIKDQQGDKINVSSVEDQIPRRKGLTDISIPPRSMSSGKKGSDRRKTSVPLQTSTRINPRCSCSCASWFLLQYTRHLMRCRTLPTEDYSTSHTP